MTIYNNRNLYRLIRSSGSRKLNAIWVIKESDTITSVDRNALKSSSSDPLQ